MRLYIRLMFALAGVPLLGAVPAAAVQDEGYIVDFDNQQLQVVLSALAEAAGLNVILGDIPSDRTTLRMAEPVPRGQLLEVIRNVAETNDLIMTMEGSIIRIERSRRRRSAPWLSSMPDLELFTYRLKHTSAAQLAPVLMNLVSGSGGRRNFNSGRQTGPGNDRGRGQNNRFSGNGQNPIELLRQFGQQGGVRNGRVNVNGREVPIESVIAGMRGFERMGQGDDDNGGMSSGDGLSISANEVRIVAEEATNTLLIRATAEDWELIKKIVETVDLRPLQVLIEVTIVEVTRSKSLDVGVGATVTHDENGRVQRAELPAVANARDFILTLTGGRGAIDFTAALNALATRGELRVVSLPIIIAQNNKEAMLNVGSSRPFVQVSQTVPNDPTGRVETIQYLDVGTTLTLTPTINPDGYVNLVVTQTANTATNEIQFDAPVLSKREATTQVFLRDGQTTVIGGLADNTRDRVRSGIPVLSWIPLIGGLFRTTHNSDVQSELYLFLTPHIISEDADIDRLRDAVQQESDLLRKVPLQQRIPPRQADTISTSQLVPVPVPQVAPVAPVTPPVSADTVRPNPSAGPGRRPWRRPGSRRPPAPPDSVPPPDEAGGERADE